MSDLRLNGGRMLLEQVKKDTQELKDTLPQAISNLEASLSLLSDRIERLGNVINSAISVAQNSIPIKVVYIILGIVVLAFAGGATFKALLGLFKITL